MKKFKNPVFKFLVVLFLLVAFFTCVSYATEDIALISEDEPVATSENNEVVISTAPITSVNKGDLYLFQDTVNIDLPVSGNVFVMASEVTINSVIDGNVFILADKVNIATKTYVYSSMFICANEIAMNGYAYDVYAVSNTFDLTSNARIIRDLKASADSLKLNGTVKRNANLTFNNIEVDETLATIGGNLNYSSSSASIPESIVLGEISFNEEKQIPVIGGIIALLVAIFGLGILVYAISHSKINAKKKNVVAEDKK